MAWATSPEEGKNGFNECDTGNLIMNYITVATWQCVSSSLWSPTKCLRIHCFSLTSIIIINVHWVIYIV